MTQPLSEEEIALIEANPPFIILEDGRTVPAGYAQVEQRLIATIRGFEAENQRLRDVLDKIDHCATHNAAVSGEWIKGKIAEARPR